jgi:hypothetical protein
MDRDELVQAKEEDEKGITFWALSRTESCGDVSCCSLIALRWLSNTDATAAALCACSSASNKNNIFCKIVMS